MCFFCLFKCNLYDFFSDIFNFNVYLKCSNIFGSICYFKVYVVKVIFVIKDVWKYNKVVVIFN